MARSKSGGSSKSSTTTDYRSAKTGRFVTPSYANRHKSTTVNETNRKK